jgi:hypothetical protein
MDDMKNRYFFSHTRGDTHVQCYDCPDNANLVLTILRLGSVTWIDEVNEKIATHEKKFHTERTTFKVRSAGVPGWDPLMIMSVHKQDKCSGDFCVIHKPSIHHMRFWPIVFDPDLQFLASRLCEHGFTHPDPDSLAYFEKIGTDYSQHFGCETDDRPCCCIEEN